MSYHRFKDEQGNEFGSFEVFRHNGEEQRNDVGTFLDDYGEPYAAGWYWWACFPGCLPDGEPYGPFQTEQDAINDAQENA